MRNPVQYKIYRMIDQINTEYPGIWFLQLEGYSMLGEPLSNAHEHPLQFIAYTNLRPGDDDPFEGSGWTPEEAIQNLVSILDEHFNNPSDDD